MRSMELESRKVLSITLRPRPAAVEAEDEVAVDEPTCIFLNGEYHVTLIATPTMKKELALGYLHSEGVIDSMEDIRTIRLRGNDVLLELGGDVDVREAAVDMMNIVVTACGSRPRGTAPPKAPPKVESPLRIEADKVLGMIRDLNGRSHVHRRTGGTHAAMLCSGEGKTLAFAEDVGRHNAVDKVIGSMLLAGMDPAQCVLISSGRQSGEMVQKVAQAGIPIVASMAVPLTSGIRLAEMSGVTLVHFGRGRLQVYSHPQRLRVDSTLGS